jgi:hypothetical protein
MAISYIVAFPRGELKEKTKQVLHQTKEAAARYGLLNYGRGKYKIYRYSQWRKLQNAKHSIRFQQKYTQFTKYTKH